MSRWRSDPLRLAIGATSLSWAHAGQALSSVATPSPDVQALREALAPALTGGGRRSREVRVWVGASLAVHWLQQPARGVSSMRELQALAAARCAQLFGADPAWEIVGDWHATRPFLCAAIPSAWANALRKGLSGHRVHLTTAFAAALDLLPAAPDDGDAVVLRAGDRSLLLSSGHRHWRGARACRLEGAKASRDTQVSAELHRWALREGWSAPTRVRWIEFDAPTDTAVIDDAALVMTGTPTERVTREPA